MNERETERENGVVGKREREKVRDRSAMEMYLILNGCLLTNAWMTLEI